MAPYSGHLFFIGKIAVQDHDFSLFSPYKAVKMLDEGGFTRTCVTDKSQYFSPFYLKRDIVKRREHAKAFRVVGIGQVIYLDHFRHIAFFRL